MQAEPEKKWTLKALRKKWNADRPTTTSEEDWKALFKKGQETLHVML